MIIIEPNFVISDDVYIDNYKIVVYSFVFLIILKFILYVINKDYKRFIKNSS